MLPLLSSPAWKAGEDKRRAVPAIDFQLMHFTELLMQGGLSSLPGRSGRLESLPYRFCNYYPESLNGISGVRLGFCN